MWKRSKINNFLFAIFWLTVVACSGGGGPPQVAPPPPPVAFPVPFFDSILAPEEREGLSEKYRLIFSSEKILKAIQTENRVSFPEWSDEEKKKFLQTIVFYEKNRGELLPPFEGACSLEAGDPPCITLSRLRISRTQFHPDYARYLRQIHIAWNLYVEANRLVPWTLLSFSEENLNFLFFAAITQPRFARQFFGVSLNPIENYQIVRGGLREEGDPRNDLVQEDALRTLLGILEFAGRRLTHFTGADNNIGPDSASWPYPVQRMPTPKEVLIDHNPHRNLRQNPQALFGPKYHIVIGCWGAAQLLKSLLASINLPVQLLGDYVNFGGHAGARFLEISSNNYFLEHADDFYHFPWTLGLLQGTLARSHLEIWNNPDFHPFSNWSASYSVLHGEKLPVVRDHAELLQFLKIGEPDHVALFEQELGAGFGPNLFDLDLRFLATRMLWAPSILTLFGRCEEPDLNRRHLPLPFLTQWEEIFITTMMDDQILERRQAAGNEALPCFDLLFNELNELYKNKTGVELRGDEDGDGFENFRDCNIYKVDPAPCDKAFYIPLEIPRVG